MAEPTELSLVRGGGGLHRCSCTSINEDPVALPETEKVIMRRFLSYCLGLKQHLKVLRINDAHGTCER